MKMLQAFVPLFIVLFLFIFDIPEIEPQQMENKLAEALPNLSPPDYGLLIHTSYDDSLTKIYNELDSLYGILCSYVGKIKETKGILIRDVIENSAAEKTGIKKGDILLTLDGQTLRNVSTKEFIKTIRSYKPGTTVHFEFFRDGEIFSIEVALEPSQGDCNESSMGAFVVSTLDRKGPILYRSGIHIIEVHKSSSGEYWGLKEGDIITSVDNKPLKGIVDFYEFLKGKSKGDTLFLEIIRPTKIILKKQF